MPGEGGGWEAQNKNSLTCVFFIFYYYYSLSYFRGAFALQEASVHSVSFLLTWRMVKRWKTKSSGREYAWA